MSNTSDRAMQAMADERGGTPKPQTMIHLNSEGIRKELDTYRIQVAQLLPPGVDAIRCLQLATSVIANDPKLKNCTTRSLIGCVMQASILGLDLSTQLGHAYIVPFWNSDISAYEAQFMIGYKGYINMMVASGKVLQVFAYVVRKSDLFRVVLGDNPKIDHEPYMSGERGEVTHAYAVAVFKDGGRQFEYLSFEQIMDAKKASKAGDSKYSPWNGSESDKEMMYRKSAIRKMQHFIPLTKEAKAAFQSDERVITPDMFDKSLGNISPQIIDTPNAEVLEPPTTVKPEPEPEKEKKLKKK